MSQRIAWNKGIKTGYVPHSAFRKGNGLIELPMEEIKHLYSKGHTCRKIGLLFGVCHHVISRRLTSMNMAIRTKAEDKLLNKNPQYKDGSSNRIYKRGARNLFPHTCNRCEVSNKKLEVHHIDGNRKNNPSDGSNWELLCHKCHRIHHIRLTHPKKI
jgi:hypothetical protein